MSPKDAQALDVLRGLWGDGYAIYYDPTVRRWTAERRGVAHRIMTAASAEELGKKVAEDYEAAK